MIRYRALILFLLALMGFSAVSSYATAIDSHSESVRITTSRINQDFASKIFTVMVSSQGFNGSSNTLNLEVSQGDQVEITFIYDSTVNTAHQIQIEGYNIKTSIIDKKNTASKIQFVAGQVGTFLIHCIIPCVGMENLQNAWLIVQQSAGIAIGTIVALRNLNVTGSELNIVARVTDRAGNPIGGLLVNFYVSTDFGMMNIGNNVTDTDGVARFDYPLASIRNMTVQAFFPGSGIYQSGNATALLTPSNSGTILVLVGGQTNNPPGGEGSFFDTRLVGVSPEVSVILATLVVVAVLCVWSTYAYVISLVLKIKRESSKNKRGS